MINRLSQAPFAKGMQLDANSESDGRNGDKSGKEKEKEKEDIALLSITHDGGYICAMVLYTGVDTRVGGVGKMPGVGGQVLGAAEEGVRGKRVDKGAVQFGVPEWVRWLGTGSGMVVGEGKEERGETLEGGLVMNSKER